MIRVLVVDDQPLIRKAITSILRDDPTLTVIGEAVNGREAIDQCLSAPPDVVLMDIRMPVLDGIGATEAICANPGLADTKVLILTTFEEDQFIVAALRAGASGFIGKSAEPDEITRAIHAVAAGDSLLSPIATRALITRYVLPTSRTADTDLGAVAALTEREREVLILVARGHDNNVIAAQLNISPHTAKTHLNRIMTKLAAHDRAQLVIAAYESGLIDPRTP